MTDKTSEKMAPSGEQQNIIDLLDTGKNVIVEAVAGAGKSTTVIFIARHFHNKKILQLTYNASLRQELKERVDRERIENLEIHTYHSFAVKYYSPSSHTDFELRKIIRASAPPTTPIPNYDFIICDETQDMTLLYYRFVTKITTDAATPFQLLVLGDSKQSLYEFKGADSRYLSMADTLWLEHPYLKCRDFERTTLRTSYRITNPMAEFVNHVMLGENRMEAARDGCPVVYIHHTDNNLKNTIIYEITNLLENGASPSDIFILAGSVKASNRMVQMIENILVEQEIPCNIPMFENERMDDKVIQGKVVFSTFHSVKGRQRPYVFVVGFSQNYMDFFAKDAPHDECPNTLYVACTRALKRLYLLEEDKREDRPLKFLKKTHHEMKDLHFVKFKGTPKFIQPPASSDTEIEEENQETIEKKIFKNVTELIRFLSDDTYDIISPILEKIFVVEKERMKTPLNIPTVQQMHRGNYEEISDINGIAIPCMYYDYCARKNQEVSGATTASTNANIIYNIVENEIETLKKKKKGSGKLFHYVQSMFKTISKKHIQTRHYLQLSNMYIALKENLFFKLKQISKEEDYVWLTPSLIKQCFKIIRDALSSDGSSSSDFLVEETIISYDDDYNDMDELLKDANIRLFRLNARIDLITPKTIWELKCTSETTVDHLLQVVVYAWIWRVATKREHRDFKILNIKTGEIQKLNATNEELTEIMFAIFKNNYRKHKRCTDEEFLHQVCSNEAEHS